METRAFASSAAVLGRVRVRTRVRIKVRVRVRVRVRVTVSIRVRDRVRDRVRVRVRDSVRVRVKLGLVGAGVRGEGFGLVSGAPVVHASLPSKLQVQLAFDLLVALKG